MATGETRPAPRASPEDQRARALAKVEAALDNLTHGRITVVMQDGRPVRVEVTDQDNLTG